MKVKVLSLMILVFLAAACVQMRDYTGKKNGAAVILNKQEFGTGASGRDYYMVDSEMALIVDDTKNEVTQKIGSPDSIKRTIDGSEVWLYNEKKIELVFESDRLKHWHEIKK